MVSFVVEVVGWLIVRLSVAIESQPFALTVLKVYEPDSLYVVPFQTKLTQAVSFVVDVVGWLIVRFSVAIESQPFAFTVVNVYEPDSL